MIISPNHKFVYVGIPRTASKSMNEWLMRHYGGIWYGGHHDYRGIPDGARSFLVFTMVRNPYDRAVSGYFGLPWDDLPRCIDHRVAVEPPTTNVIDDLIRRDSDPDARPVPYRDFIEGAGVSRLLYFERLPDCLLDLPFVEPSSVGSFPHVLERGVRPPGGFGDFFNDRYEEFIWNSYKDDFVIAGYERHNVGLVDQDKASMSLSARSDRVPLRSCSVSKTLWDIAEQPEEVNGEQECMCRELFAVQAQVHPVPALRTRFGTASTTERISRQLVCQLAAFAMEPENA